jgi:hypothetical protein
MSNLVAPEKGLTIALLQSVEGTGGPPTVAQAFEIADYSRMASAALYRNASCNTGTPPPS